MVNWSKGMSLLKAFITQSRYRHMDRSVSTVGLLVSGYAVVVVIVALLYWGTPNIRPASFRWVSPGAVIAIVVGAVCGIAAGAAVDRPDTTVPEVPA